MRVEVTGQEVRDIVRREVVNALDVRNVSKTPQPDVKNIILQQTIQSLIQGRLNDVFQTALSFNDLTLAVFTLLPAHSSCPSYSSCPLTWVIRQRSSMPS